MNRRLQIAAIMAALLAVPLVASSQDLTTLLAIFLRNLHAGRIVIPQFTTFAALPTIQNGVIVYCSDCAEGADPATGSSTGAFALRVNGRWVTLDGGSGGGGHTIQDEGSNLTARTGLNFVGAGVTCADDAGNDQTDCTIPGDLTHALLSSTHTDTSAASVVRGDILTGNSTPAWSRLAIGSYAQAPVSTGTDLTYQSISFMGGFLGASGFTTSSTTYVDVTGLTIPLAANQLFAFDVFGTFTTSDNAAGATNGIGFSVNGTGGTSQAAVYTIWIQTTDNNTAGNNTVSTTPFSYRNETGFDSMTALASVVTVATSLKFMIRGFYYTGTSGTSTLAIRVRSENGAPQTAKVQVGTYMLLTKQG